MEDVVERMRGDISVGLKPGDVFSVGYAGDNPRTVKKVAERLAGLFMRRTWERESLANGTSQFLDSTVKDARRRLADSEKKLREYRQKYMGQLPQQLEANLQAMSRTMKQVQQLNDGDHATASRSSSSKSS